MEEALHRELQGLLSSFLQSTPDENKMHELADELAVSLPTMQRWAEGKNLPHRAMCPSIIEHLKNRVPTGP